MLLCIDRPTMTATAHDRYCDRLSDPYFNAERPFARMGAGGGWFPIASKDHAQDVVAKYLPDARLIGCRTCFENGTLRPFAPNQPPEDWDIT